MAKQEQTEFKTWDAYVAEAEIEPFKIPVSADEVIEVHAPSGTALVQVMRGIRNGDLDLIIQTIMGEDWDRLYELLNRPGVTHKVLTSILEDMLDHFELYEDVVLVHPDGHHKVTKRRPTEIQTYLSRGYRPLGEAPASL